MNMILLKMTYLRQLCQSKFHKKSAQVVMRGKENPMEIKMRQMPTHLNMSYDPVFKKIYGIEEFVTGLIETFLKKKVHILEFIDKESLNVEPGLKQMRGDIIVVVNGTEFINIEMQKQKTKSDFRRAYYYRSSMAVNELKKGNDYDKYRFSQIFITDYDWKEGGIVIPQATIMERTEMGINFHDLIETKYVSLNSAESLLEKDIDDFTEEELWIFFMKYRHEESMRDKIEQIKLKDKRLQAIDDALLELEDDYAFMRKMSYLIDKACDDMDIKDAESARQEAKQERAEKEKEREAKEMYKKEAEKQKHDNEFLTLCMQYVKEGHSPEKAEELASKALNTQVPN